MAEMNISKTNDIIFNSNNVKVVVLNSNEVWRKHYTLSFSNGGYIYTIKSKDGTDVIANPLVIPYGSTLSTNGQVLTITKPDSSTEEITATMNSNAAYNYAFQGWDLSATTVESDMLIKPRATASVKSYTLTLTKNSNVASVTATRTSSPNKGAATGTLSSGATIYYGDVITCSATSNTGYTFASSATTYTTTASSNYTVSGDVTYSPTVKIAQFKLTITKNTGISTIYYRVSGASSYTSTTSSTSVNYDYGTVIEYYAIQSTGYKAPSVTKLTPGTVTIGTSGGTISPTAAAYGTYSITIASGFTVNRTSSPAGASTGTLSNNATIREGDVLSVSTAQIKAYSTNSTYYIRRTFKYTNGTSSLTATGSATSSTCTASITVAGAVKLNAATDATPSTWHTVWSGTYGEHNVKTSAVNFNWPGSATNNVSTEGYIRLNGKAHYRSATGNAVSWTTGTLPYTTATLKYSSSSTSTITFKRVSSTQFSAKGNHSTTLYEAHFTITAVQLYL